MDDLSTLGRLLLVVGLVVAGIGLLLVFADRIPLLGRLPGDVVIKGDRWSFYAPIGTSILISIVLTLVVSAFAMLGRR